MGPARKEPLSHNEIWDDSALVESWNDALNEYEKYHSIHRNGGNVEDLLNSDSTTSDAKNETGKVPGARLEGTNGGRESGTSTTQHSHPLGGAPAPGGLLGSIRDERLKKLLMSWYYAGYYTGFYEGQQAQSQPQPQEPEQS